jgi:hypothetical protein
MLTAWLMMLAAGVRLVMCCGRSCLADAAGLPRFCFWLGVGSDWLFGGAGVGDFPGFSQKLILVLTFPADIEWGWGPKNSQPPGEVNTKNYQNDFFKGGKHGKRNTDTIYSTTCMGEGAA